MSLSHQLVKYLDGTNLVLPDKETYYMTYMK